VRAKLSSILTGRCTYVVLKKPINAVTVDKGRGGRILNKANEPSSLK